MPSGLPSVLLYMVNVFIVAKKCCCFSDGSVKGEEVRSH